MAGLISSKVGETLINEERSLTMMRIMAIINSVNYGMLAIDEDDKIIYCNQIAESIIETEPEQLIGRCV